MLRKLILLISLPALFLAGTVCVQGQVVAPRSFSGAINNRYAIKMSLSIEGSKVSGSYYYVKVGKPIAVRGSLDNSGRLSLEELDPTGLR
jgi:hypothetical protein